MLRGGRIVLLEGQAEHIDVGVLSTLSISEWSSFRLHNPVGFYAISALGIITLGVFRKAQFIHVNRSSLGRVPHLVV